MAEIELQDVSKTYKNGARALVSCNLTVAQGEWLVLVGPSGCGKTTMLRLIAGLDEADEGTIRLGGKPMKQVPSAQRDVAMVFQRPGWFPNKSVRGNLAFGMRLQAGLRRFFSPSYKALEESRVREVAECLCIGHLLERFPAELSGGEQQRVALGRALLRGARIGLLDEPFGHLDAPLRLKLLRELPLLRSRFPATMVIVTHDPAEALSLGDRIAVLQAGAVLQVDTPERIRREPCHPVVAELFQAPA